jgi:hypothetical protein
MDPSLGRAHGSMGGTVTRHLAYGTRPEFDPALDPALARRSPGARPALARSSPGARPALDPALARSSPGARPALDPALARRSTRCLARRSAYRSA